jgi:transcriptional regulator with AAA-type ATPase domain
MSDEDRGPAVSDIPAGELAAEGILGHFEGSPVTQTGVEIRNAAGGLNESLQTENMVKQKGDHYYVLLRCDVIDLHFPNVKGHEDQSRRVHVSRATDATIMDAEMAEPLIRKQQTMNRERREAAKAAAEDLAGILTFPTDATMQVGGTPETPDQE